LVLGRRPLGAILHSSNEPGELSQWLCHDDSTINIVLDIIIIIIIIIIILHADLIMCYKIVFGLVSVHSTNFLQLSPLTHTRGHLYKLFKQCSSTSIGTSFVGNRVINVLSHDIVDFTTLKKFKSS